MELKHEQAEPERMTEAELLERYDHWDGHAKSCITGLKLALKHMDLITRTIEVQKALGIQDDSTNA